jgi:hypothetical protein
MSGIRRHINDRAAELQLAVDHSGFRRRTAAMSGIRTHALDDRATELQLAAADQVKITRIRLEGLLP